jgi:hypothetical protein
MDEISFKDKSKIIYLLGSLILLIGLSSAFIAPIEIYSYYLFSKGGRFYIEGFGMGSLMFANITIQIIAYYLIAVLFIILGYGHLKLREWARSLSVAVLWAWMVIGAPLVLVLIFMFSVKSPSVILMVIAILLVYPVIPLLMIWFYKTKNVLLTFNKIRDNLNPSYNNQANKTPIIVTTISVLFIFFIIVFHIHFLFNGFFPLFGKLLSGLNGFILIDIFIFLIGFLIWGLLRLKSWSWYGSVVYLIFLILSTGITLYKQNIQSLLSVMAFAPKEMEIINNITLKDWQISIILGVSVITPLIITTVLLAISKRYFKKGL